MLRALVATYLRRADRVVAIGETMRERLVAKGTPRDRIAVIPNWVDTAELAPAAARQRVVAGHGLAGRFVVMNSGNVGQAQDLDSLDPRRRLRWRTSRFAIVGKGRAGAELERLAGDLDAANVRFLDYQPREMLAVSLSAASVHVVGLARGPLRLRRAEPPLRRARGRPARDRAADDESETAQLVRSAGCGLVVPPGQPESLAAAIRECRDGAHDLEAMGRRGREWVESEADRSVAVGRYRELLRELVGR